MKTTGGCFCGAITYAAEFDERRVGVCHCRDCQIFSGSAFRMATIVAPGGFTITKGEPRAFDKTADSGNVRRMLFCGECGTHLASAPPDPDAPGAFVSIRIATCVDFAKLEPAGELWCSSRVPWMPELAGTAKVDGQS